MNLVFLSLMQKGFNKFLSISEVNLTLCKCPNTSERECMYIKRIHLGNSKSVESRSPFSRSPWVEKFENSGHRGPGKGVRCRFPRGFEDIVAEQKKRIYNRAGMRRGISVASLTFLAEILPCQFRAILRYTGEYRFPGGVTRELNANVGKRRDWYASSRSKEILWGPITG